MKAIIELLDDAHLVCPAAPSRGHRFRAVVLPPRASSMDAKVRYFCVRCLLVVEE